MNALRDKTSDSQRGDWNDLSRILSRLDRLDLSGKVLEQDTVMDAHGGYCDVFVGFIPLECLDGRRLMYPRDGRVKVAIKRLRVRLSKELPLAKSIAREMAIWSKLHHPNILPLLGYILEKDYPSFVSEWMDQGTVREFLKTNPNANVKHLALGVAEGIKYMHDRDIVHSDIKADNVLMSEHGEPLICDFGISRMLDSSQSNFVSTTHNGQLRGSMRWMARELLRPDGDEEPKHSKETDVWAYGMTLYELCTGQLPYYRLKNDGNVVLAIARGALPEFIQVPSSHQAVYSLCLTCWAKDPKHRPTMSWIVERLSDQRDSRDLRPPSAFLLGNPSRSRDQPNAGTHLLPQYPAAGRPYSVGESTTIPYPGYPPPGGSTVPPLHNHSIPYIVTMPPTPTSVTSPPSEQSHFFPFSPYQPRPPAPYYPHMS